MLYLITYDVPTDYDKFRAIIAAILKGYGLIRIQYSVFWGDITQNLAQEIALRIRERLKKVPMDVRIVPICSSCLNKAIFLNNYGYRDAKGLASLNVKII